MKSYLFKVFSLIAVVSIVSTVSIVNASSITREYDQDYYELGFKDFSFKVRMTIETESNGAWKTDTDYQVDYMITLTYLNESRLDSNSFRIHFYSPVLLINRIPFASDHYEITKNETFVGQGQIGTLTVRYRHMWAMRVETKCWIRYDAYDSVRGTIIGGDYWHQPEPIWIDILKKETESGNASDYVNPIPYIGVGIVIVALPIGAYFIYKSRKTKRDPPTT
jgi:hypothetical protein